jgi:hypothetical protein
MQNFRTKNQNKKRVKRQNFITKNQNKKGGQHKG